MSWQNEFQRGSFRGAAFRTESHERSGGRRIATFEFPSRDEPLTEDLGRRQRQFGIECHVIGSDYRTARDALIEALEAAGAGLLIHPWYGQLQVVVQEFSASESTDEGGICRFHISFAESGQAVTAPIAAPSGLAASVAADAHEAALPHKFASRFSIDGAAGFVEDSAARLVSGITDISQYAASLQGGIGPALRAFDAGLRYLPANISSLLRSPLNLANAIIGLVGAVSLIGNSPRGRLGALSRLVDWEPGTALVPALTPSRRLEAGNSAALLWLFHSVAAGELVRTAALAPFSSYDEAAATRDAIAARLDRLALAAADQGDDDGAAGFDTLRRALVRDIAARSISLARLYTIETAATEPALAIANRHYGAAGVAARADELAARNRVVHPGFVPGGRAIALVTIGAPQ